MDLGYALEHYEEYAGNYTANQESSFENHSVLHTEDDLEYVEGMWAPDRHEEQTGSIGNSYLNSNEVML